MVMVSRCIHCSWSDIFFGELGFALTTEDWKQVVDAARQRRRLNPTSATTVVDVDDLDAVMNIDSECIEELAMRDSAIVVADNQQGNRFASMPLDMLAVVAQRQDECIRDLRRKLKVARQQNRRKEDQLKKALQITERDPDLSTIDLARSGKKRLAPRGVIALAVRRNMSNVPCEGVSAILLEDLSRQTVARAEICAAAALNAASRAWYQINFESLIAAPQLGGDLSAMAIHCVRGDATNARVFNNSKVHNLDCESLILAASLEPHADAFQQSHNWADLQIVSDGSAKGTRMLILKQLMSMGVQTWCQVANAACKQHEFHLYIMVSDGGPDQLACKKMAENDVAHQPNCAIWKVTCLMHAGQLNYRTGFNIIDEYLKLAGRAFTFMSAHSKTVLVWRDNGQAAGVGSRLLLQSSCECSVTFTLYACLTVKRSDVILHMFVTQAVFGAWLRIHGAESALHHAHHLPPKVVSGRWGSIDSSMKALADANGLNNRVHPVLESVLAKKIESSSRQDHEDDDEADLRASAQQAYRQQMGRWSRQVLAIVGDEVFWFVQSGVRQAHTVAQHFLHFLEHSLTPGEEK